MTRGQVLAPGSMRHLSPASTVGMPVTWRFVTAGWFGGRTVNPNFGEAMSTEGVEGIECTDLGVESY